MTKKVFKKTVGMIKNYYQKMAMFSFILWASTVAKAQGVDAGKLALTAAASDIAKYIPAVQKLIYAIAGIVAIIGAISVYIKMNNEDQDVKKSIMMIIGACIFLLAAATALPQFFGFKG